LLRAETAMIKPSLSQKRDSQMETTPGKFNVADIQRLYRDEAERHGSSGTSTIQDARSRQLELSALISAFPQKRASVLEVGCGNGYVAMQVAATFSGIEKFDAFDFSEAFVAIAKAQAAPESGIFPNFTCSDVLALDAQGVYDVIYSQRCLQNLTSWEYQKTGLANVVRALKPGGHYVMQEGFLTGLNNLNEARAEFDLEPIPESWHNHFFDEGKTRAFMEERGCRVELEVPFLSGYYFGSRVLLPALMPKGKTVTSKSRLNDYFCALPAVGDFCPMKLLRFVKAAA
jgi:SAM-dependent methyltransferase